MHLSCFGEMLAKVTFLGLKGLWEKLQLNFHLSQGVSRMKDISRGEGEESELGGGDENPVPLHLPSWCCPSAMWLSNYK